MQKEIKSIPIYLSSDDKYAPFVATTMASICDNTTSFCEFYILDGGISRKNQDKICELKKQFSNFSVEFIETKGNTYIENINYRNDVTHVTLATYNRLLIPEIKLNIDKAIYLDVDTIVLKDILDFYKQDLRDSSIGVVADSVPPKHINQVNDDIGMKQDSVYFNAGVLLIDCKRCREQNAVNKMFEIASKKQDKLHMADQDILNIFFENKKVLLDSSFNVLYKHNSPHIRHFIGDIKPWHINPQTECKYIANLIDFWKYAQMTPFYIELKSKTENQDLQNELYRKLRFISVIQNISNKRNKVSL